MTAWEHTHTHSFKHTLIQIHTIHPKTAPAALQQSCTMIDPQRCLTGENRNTSLCIELDSVA